MKEPPPTLVPIVDGEQRPEDAVALPMFNHEALTIGRGDDVMLNLIDETRPREAASHGQPGPLVHRKQARIELWNSAYWLHVLGANIHAW